MVYDGGSLEFRYMDVDEVLVDAARCRRFAGDAAFGTPLVFLDIDLRSSLIRASRSIAFFSLISFMHTAAWFADKP
jgi:hypothetical protein